jgi:RNA polymerase sigma-70 factor (ECF subfamily)
MAIEHQTEDQALLSRMATRDQTALSELYDRYVRVVNGLAFKILGNAEEAEEVVIDVFDQAWRTAGRYDGGRGRVDSWLFLMTRSRALDRLRSRARVERSTVASEDAAAVDIQIRVADPEADALCSERREVVKAALGTLPEGQRRALELAYFDGLSHSEIADRIGEPLGTVKTRVRLGMGKLRETLAPFWGGTAS